MIFEYNITISQVRVGSTLIDVEFGAFFDSGTSFTYLVDPTRPIHLARLFNSPDSNTSLIPSIRVVYDPMIIISRQSELVYCLAVVKSAKLNIIGRNGHHVVFDREKLILGWKKSDCYDIEDHNNALPTRQHSDKVLTDLLCP
ncbi:Eukaryotic aspartyl protease family protein [Trifolium repens]|nr:Eukaryotic aspartyl protease family protein [Trifolium repens]